MIYYIINDLKDALIYLPQSICIGMVIAAIICGLNALGKKKNKKTVSVMKITALAIYIMILLFLTFFSRESGSRVGVDLQIGTTWNINPRNNAYVIENILLFIPYGILIPLNSKLGKNFFFNLLCSFFTSLSIETVQLITGRGYFQIDDIITNVLGGCIGYLLFFCFCKVIKNHNK